MFSGCSKLESITISNSVTTIKDNTFNLCDKLTSVTIPKSVTKIESFAFNCSSLRSINYQGKISEWNTIDLDTNWKAYSPITSIHCTDGDITL